MLLVSLKNNKKMNIKTTVLILLSLTTMPVFSQMIPCVPPQDPPCSNQCMSVTIDNQTTCSIPFYWGYSNCTYILGYSNSPVPPNTSVTYSGQCAKCQDSDPCDCPDRIFISNAAGTEYYPWGNFSSMTSSGNSIFNVPAVDNIVCPSCLPSGQLKISTFINSSTSVTIKIECN